jgi:hypothetical protein
MSSTSSPPWIGILRSSRTVRAAETEADKIAKLKFPPESARWIADELWHPRQRLERSCEGGGAVLGAGRLNPGLQMVHRAFRAPGETRRRGDIRGDALAAAYVSIEAVQRTDREH